MTDKTWRFRDGRGREIVMSASDIRSVQDIIELMNRDEHPEIRKNETAMSKNKQRAALSLVGGRGVKRHHPSA
ncbi:hypothetical protein [Paenibacillus tengchongensis]|uniref:hypothetical protein n=1 Tax=Paenibacillus tengchongensis TaxID=2608684 RepID=UPI00124C9512|nr:hypothetical protein [Paenibacillus tengchongensis]